MSEWSASERERLIRAVEKIASEIGCAGIFVGFAIIMATCAVSR